MPIERSGAEYMSITELAEILQVHRTAVFYWIRMGKIKAVRLGLADQSPYGIPIEEAQRVISQLTPNSV